MKKRSAKDSKIIKRIFNRMGMTYVELICALALLSLIVMMFTPMLLSSYETLYKAGEKIESVYDSKVEIESGLASRNSVNLANIGMTFKMNSTNLFEKMNVGGRKIVSHFQSELETVFHGARARVDLLSPSIVYDDKSWHDIILQTTGLDWNDGDIILFNGSGGNLDTMKADLLPNQILIDIIKPDKTQSTSGGTTSDSQVYNLGDRVGVKSGSFIVDAVNKKISLQINGVDFTTSPLKISVYYKNERGVLKTLADYMYIKPAHIIMAGDTSGSDYYTSAGIEQKDISEGEGQNATHTIQYKLSIEGRGMSLSNSRLLNSGPSGKDVIKVVEYIGNDEESGFDPYYVLAGTNGSVYRMYNLKKQTSSLQSLLGSAAAIDATTEYDFIIQETGEKIYPSFWSGDISDQYSFQTMFKSSTYGNAEDNDVDCSAPNNNKDQLGDHSFGVIGTQYNKFDTKLRYSMVFNGFRTGYKYASQASRKISYVLAEQGNQSFRIGGKKQDEGDFIGYHIPWEYGSDYKTFEGGLFSANTSDEEVIYLGGTGAAAAENKHSDKHMGYLRLNSYTQINPLDALADDNNKIYQNTGGGYESLYNRLVTGGEFWSPPGYSEASVGYDEHVQWKDRVNYISTDQGCKVEVSSVAYLPGSSSDGSGQVIYFGSVPAYALIRQSSDIEEGEKKVYNTKNVVGSAATIYLVCGSYGGGTTIYRNAYGGKNGNKTENVDAHNVMRADLASNTVTTVTDANAFYTSGNDSVTYKLVDNDTSFTFGYCSRWRMTVGNVTFDGSIEETKSYEKYYKASHSNWTYNRKPGLNAGGVNNIYYNVWFPGEFYNLTATDSLDGVTVAVGYTVSGSTFMEQSAYASEYYGTALGSIYNDGVLAAYTEDSPKKTVSGKGDQTTIFQNLLYYKMPQFKNNDTTKHSRESIRFTVVGLNAESERESETSNKGTKEYYAYYGDSNGHVYRSLVATADDVTFDDGDPNTEEDDKTTETVNLVQVIPDTKLSDSVKASRTTNGLEEIKLTGAYAGITMNQLFKEITAIECNDDLIIITGIPQAVEAGNVFGAAYNGFVVGIKDDNGNWEWKVHAMEVDTVPGGLLQNSTLDCAKIIGNYLYLSGYGNTSGKGNECWVAGINLEVFKKLPNSQAVPFVYESSATDTTGIWMNLGTSNRIYAIGGHADS